MSSSSNEMNLEESVLEVIFDLESGAFGDFSIWSASGAWISYSKLCNIWSNEIFCGCSTCSWIGWRRLFKRTESEI